MRHPYVNNTKLTSGDYRESRDYLAISFVDNYAKNRYRKTKKFNLGTIMESVSVYSLAMQRIRQESPFSLIGKLALAALPAFGYGFYFFPSKIQAVRIDKHEPLLVETEFAARIELAKRMKSGIDKKTEVLIIGGKLQISKVLSIQTKVQLLYSMLDDQLGREECEQVGFYLKNITGSKNDHFIPLYQKILECLCKLTVYKDQGLINHYKKLIFDICCKSDQKLEILESMIETAERIKDENFKGMLCDIYQTKLDNLFNEIPDNPSKTFQNHCLYLEKYHFLEKYCKKSSYTAKITENFSNVFALLKKTVFVYTEILEKDKVEALIAFLEICKNYKDVGPKQEFLMINEAYYQYLLTMAKKIACAESQRKIYCSLALCRIKAFQNFPPTSFEAKDHGFKALLGYTVLEQAARSILIVKSCLEEANNETNSEEIRNHCREYAKTVFVEIFQTYFDQVNADVRFPCFEILIDLLKERELYETLSDDHVRKLFALAEARSIPLTCQLIEHLDNSKRHREFFDRVKKSVLNSREVKDSIAFIRCCWKVGVDPEQQIDKDRIALFILAVQGIVNDFNGKKIPEDSRNRLINTLKAAINDPKDKFNLILGGVCAVKLDHPHLASDFFSVANNEVKETDRKYDSQFLTMLASTWLAVDPTRALSLCGEIRKTALNAERFISLFYGAVPLLVYVSGVAWYYFKNVNRKI